MTASLDTALAHLARGEWQPAHAIVQADESPLGCWAHGIVHVLEGDLDNARYWYGRAQRPWPRDYAVDAEVAALKAAHEARGRARGDTP
ncbi:MAG TPA: hypothetical protein VFX05_03670 [Casimicrobiaceae bacterium]|nr:hypothetical protein [Casimicrobiaceae bacterium]